MDAKTQPGLPSVKVLFKDSWETFTHSILPLFLLNILGLVVYVVLGVVGFLILVFSGVGSSLLKTGLQNIPGALASITASAVITTALVAVVFGIIMILVSVALQIASVYIVDSAGKKSVGESFKKSFGLIIPLFLVGILTFILEVGGLFVFVLPAIIMAILFLFVQFEVILNGQRWTNALKRSNLLVSRHFGGILGRAALLVLVYVGFSILGNLIGKIGPDMKALVGFLTFFINILLGWFALAYYITLYKQARSGMDQTKGSGIAWMWIVAILGWIIAIGIGFSTWKVISSGILNNLMPKTPQDVTEVAVVKTSNWLVDDANNKMQQVIEIQTKKNLTDVDRQQIVILATTALSEYSQATQKDPTNVDAWSSLAQINKVLGDSLGKNANNTDKATFYNNSAQAYYNLGQVYMQLGDKQKAKTSFQQALDTVTKDAATLRSNIQKAINSI